jgi:hypothetical protein
MTIHLPISGIHSFKVYAILQNLTKRFGNLYITERMPGYRPAIVKQLLGNTNYRESFFRLPLLPNIALSKVTYITQGI